MSSIESARGVEGLRRLIVERLPARVRWFVDETLWNWDFSRANRPLEPVADDDAKAWIEVLPVDWRDLLIFGEEDFAGGASPFLCVHAGTGEVFGLDVERERSAAFFLNSSIPTFIETFLLFDALMRTGALATSEVRERIRAADPGAFEKSEWRDLVDELVDLADGA